MAAGAHALKTAKRGAAAVVLLSTKTNFKNGKGGPARPSLDQWDGIDKNGIAEKFWEYNCAISESVSCMQGPFRRKRMKRSKDTISLPKGLDGPLVRQLHQRIQERRQKVFQDSSKRFLEMCRIQAKIQKTIARESGMQLRQTSSAVMKMGHELRKRLRATRRKAERAVIGHNPVRYPPFDFAAGPFISTQLNTTFSGTPRASDGRVGGDIDATPLGDNFAASLVQSTIGIVYRAESTGTLQVWAEASHDGYGYLWGGSPVFFLFSNGKAGLAVWIETDDGSSSSQTPIADFTMAGRYAVQDLTGRVGVQVSYPVQSGRMYLIFAGVVQSVFAMPDCYMENNVPMNVDSIRYNIL